MYQQFACINSYTENRLAWLQHQQQKLIMFFEMIIVVLFTGSAALNWAICQSKVSVSNLNQEYEFCDLCYVENRHSLFTEPPIATLFSDLSLSKLNCFYCGYNESTVLPYSLKSSIFYADYDKFLRDSPFAAIFALVDYTNATYGYIIRVTGEQLDADTVTVPWIFLRTNTQCANSAYVDNFLNIVNNVGIDIDNVKITSSIIDIDKQAPIMYNLISAVGMECVLFLILLLVILIKKCDRRHVVYSVDQFVDCSRTNRRIEFGVYVARFNKLAVFFSILFIIIYSIMVTTATGGMQYFYYLAYGVSSATAFMFLMARVPMKLQNKCAYFKKKSYQVSFIVITATIGALASLVILLFKDESAFRFENQFYDLCLKLLPFWFTVNIMIVVALLAHISFRSYIALALFEVGCIVIDQLFRTIPFTNKLHEYKQPKPFLDFYNMYGDAYFQINQGFTYQNSSTTISNFEPHSTPNTNPLIFKWHWHYTGFACQVPYTRIYPIWMVTTPGFVLLHGLHFNAEQSEHRSKILPVIAFLITMLGSVIEECIRLFMKVPIGIGVISFSLLSLLFILWFCKNKELGDFMHGVHIYVSRSHVSSGINLITILFFYQI